MASVQVLPNSVASSRKQGHLEAGKKRLEEFRKKKAAKKALPSANADHHEKLSQNNGNMVDGPTSTIDSDIVMSLPVSIGPDERNLVDSSQNIEFRSFSGTSATSTAQFTRNLGSYDDSLQEVEKNEVYELHGNSGSSSLANGYYDNWRENNEFIPSKENNFVSVSKDQFLASDMVHSKTSIDENISISNFPSSVEVLPGGNRKSSTIYMSASDPSRSYHNSKLSEKSESNSMQNRIGIDSSSAQTSVTEVDNSKLGGSLNYENTSGIVKGGAEIANAINRHLKVNSEHWQASEPSSTDFSATFKGSSNLVLFPSTSYGTTSDRSRPSILESLGVNKVSSKSQMPYEEARKTNSVSSFDNSKVEELFSQWQPSLENNSVDQSFSLGTLDINSEKETSVNSTIPLRNDQRVKHNMESYQNSPPHSKDEDFAALEQHIEDLTQEKFSLQRALDKSQMLAQNLAAENSSLTESYNQQGKVINRLKSDMEKLQEEIKAQFLALDSVQLEYANAQLECSAADERAKILASEVISLEEKALRLRSNELKLEKQAENLNSEISSFRRKVSSLEKEHQDFQFTIDALQEERKLLQSKIRKASVSENGNEEKKPYSDRRDASTLTENLSAEHLDMAIGESSLNETMLDSTLNTLEDAGPSVSLASNTSGTSVIYEDTSVGIPQDQIRMIDNISSLISELAVEREEIMRALKIESSNCFMLKDLNKDLTQKLEAQTQRLELLTAQQIANEVVLTKPMDTLIINDTTQYADEGDEVVERVLGWIMKLFPGGPAKRRTSKLL